MGNNICCSDEGATSQAGGAPVERKIMTNAERRIVTKDDSYSKLHIPVAGSTPKGGEFQPQVVKAKSMTAH